MSDKLNFKGVYGDDDVNMVRDIIHVAPLGVTAKRNNGVIRPHVHHELFQIIVLENGEIDFSINDSEQKLSAKSFVTIPKNIVHSLNIGKETVGWVISLHDKVLERMFQFDADLVLQLDCVNIYKLDPEDKHINDTYQTLQKCIFEYTHDLPAKEHALQYLVGMLMLRLYRISVTSEVIQLSNSKSKIQFRRFLQLIKEGNSFKISVEDYASALQLSPGHLNRICHENAGLSSKNVVLDYFVAEAKSLLIQQEMPISEVAYTIGIDNPGYFTTIFKKRTGNTPKAFRESLNK